MLLDPLHYGLAGLCFVLLVSFVFSRKGLSRERAEMSKLRKEIADEKAQPQKWELSLERFDVLWFPTVTTSPATQEVTQVSPGAPYCKTCVVPLSSPPGKGQYACPNCGSKFADSFDNLMVLDSVTRQTIRYFSGRHEEFKAPAHLVPSIRKAVG